MTQHTLEQVRAAVKEGRQFLLRPYPHTEVIVRSTNPDEAAVVVKALQPVIPADEDYDGQYMLIQLMLLFRWVATVNPDDARDWLDVAQWELNGND